MSGNEDLSHLLNSFSISNSEERITQQLDQTHLDSSQTTPSIFTVTSSSQQQQQQRLTSPITETQQQGNWTPNDTTVNTTSEEDGWGDAPPTYTAISQGTYFGFNSIMEPQTYKQNDNINNTTAFSKYKNKPVSFNSALNDHKD